MPQENQADYYIRRERECRAAAERATDPAIRQTHLNFADHYAGRIAMTASPRAIAK
jgi:hypothetical protein